MSRAELGSYILYSGSNGYNISTNSLDLSFNSACKGKNANYVNQANYYKFFTTGWRIAYTKDTNSNGLKEVYLISAGAPECITGTSSNPTKHIYIKYSFIKLL